MTTIAEELISAARQRVAQVERWKEQIAKASELRETGWVCSAPKELLAGLAAFALSGATAAVREEEERLREVAAAEERAEAQRQDRVIYMKTGVATKAEWDQKLAESKKSDK